MDKLSIPQVTNFYQGKVRDVYEVNNDYVVIVASDRISAFDVILPTLIPYKGAVLNTIAAHFLLNTRHIVKNWLLDVPFNNVSVGLKCEPIKIEIVVRGCLAGHSLREYQLGKRQVSGVTLPEGLHPYQIFDKPIITPTTKASEGHDMDISKEEIIAQGILEVDKLEHIYQVALKLFEYGQEHANSKNLILGDTKYEFGYLNDELYLIDEIHTPDSSRYFYQKGYDESVLEGKSPKQLSKEFVREWLLAQGFSGKDGQLVPVIPDDIMYSISDRYLELFKVLMGYDFNIITIDTKEQLEGVIKKSLDKLGILI